MAFHWIMVVLIIVVGVLGLLHDSWPKGTQRFWINIHALIGLHVLAALWHHFARSDGVLLRMWPARR